MKHLIRAAMVLLLTAGLAHAGAIADQDQFQGQFDGGIAGAGAGAAGQIGGGAGFQLQGGFSASDTVGDSADQNQFQTQTLTNNSLADDGQGNFAQTAHVTVQLQGQDSEVNGPGIAGAGGGQAIAIGTAGVTTGGTFGVAGSAGAAIGGSASGALGVDANSGQSQAQVGASFYEQQSVGPQSRTYQTGEQSFGTAQSSEAQNLGIAGSASGVYQAGGSVIANDGNAGGMSGQATAAGEAWAVSGAAGNADASAEAFGEQTHSYEQAAVSSDGSNFQFQQGTVTTSVQATSP